LALPAHLELPDAWIDVQAEIRRAVGDSTYEIWLAGLQASECSHALLVIRAPAARRAWIAERFGRILERCAKAVIGPQVTVEITDESTPGGPSRRPHAVLDDPLLDLEPSTSFNPRHSFDQFIIGDSNRLAHAACLAAAELPGQAYNPLFLHAPPGLGKTHLLHAIGNYVLAFGGGATVRYTTVEAFTNHFISALGSKSLSRFKRAYRDADVLLIDDVQFLASKAKTEEEFFHTFNALYETGRQLVITCDRLPRELVALEDRLRERFESGLVADIQPPDYATRLTILRKRAALDHVSLAETDVLELIAERVTANIRSLEGALIRVMAYASLTHRPIDTELAQTVLETMYPIKGRASLSVADVQRVVADYFEISVSELVSSSRTARVTWPRQLAMHLSREITRAPLEAIGQAFGGRNHSTIHYACARVSDRIASDPNTSATIDELTQNIKTRQADRDS
jgi:chromosomal replication initiator protein